jgi:hypothetical protein
MTAVAIYFSVNPSIQRVRGSFPRVKPSECEVDPSNSSSAKTKNEWSCTSSPPICLHGVERDNFTYIFLLFLLFSSVILSLY